MASIGCTCLHLEAHGAFSGQLRFLSNTKCKYKKSPGPWNYKSRVASLLVNLLALVPHWLRLVPVAGWPTKWGAMLGFG